MATKEFAEIRHAATPQGDILPDVPAFVVVETVGGRAVLSVHGGDGHLLRQSAHPAVGEARSAASSEYPTLGEWRYFSEDFPAIGAVIRERLRRRYEGDGRTLSYARPSLARPSLMTRALHIPRGFLGEVLTSVSLLIAFGLIAFPFPFGFFARSLWNDVFHSDRWDFVLKAGELGVICTLASTVLWRFRGSHLVFAFVGLFALAVSAGVFLVEAMAYSMFFGVLVCLTAGPFFVLWYWRVKFLLNRPPAPTGIVVIHKK